MGIKINELAPLGRAIISTDELELSLTGATGSRKVTGSQIIQSGGVHAPFKMATGGIRSVSAQTIGNGTVNAALALNTLTATPFRSFNDISYSSFYLNVTTAAASALVKIIVYSDLNGIPNTKIYESADLDASTTGLKVATIAGSFVAGTTYWLSVNCNSAAVQIQHIPLDALPTIGFVSSTGVPFTGYTRSSTYGTAPVTFPGPIPATSGAQPFIGITIV